ncbi:RNA-directed DNA polymerase [Sphingobacterium sp. UDSM-2020]|uniref:RNA-directed DNA polymerase n=1 Tax=Sphingobacterium sp. UDSM-2020 TaxID=2795738 RepID=UPI0019358E79|nr:RNA-directed DNA polymerase [Sphingobacterium sp. UDSM-2020]QQD12344.1 RNA-directed DNA polymerase [Sphingobacterium sp. UDSM-2020]
MEESTLLQNGYFPKELPPSFNTKELANNYSVLRSKWTKVFNLLNKEEKQKYKETNSIKYSIPKNGYIRRVLNIPNPFSQIQLTEVITLNWSDIQNKLNDSTISFSKPYYNPFSNRAFITKKNFGDFTKERLISSADMLFEVKTDISRFYNSIYTHSIPWALHGKMEAKQNRTDKNLLGNKLDKILREGNYGQTIGIPIGPDTSLIISELIHSEIDKTIQSTFPKIKFLRYIDDLYAYCDKLSDAEIFIKKYQILLTEHQLELNEEKTIITEKIFEFENKWTSQLSTFKIREFSGQGTDIERFASITFDLYKKYPNDSILFYATQILSKKIIQNEYWDIFQAILFKILLVEPKAMEPIAKIFVKNEGRVDKNTFKGILGKIIDTNIGNNHNYEVTWALWLMKEFSFKLTKSRADMIVKSGDSVSILILLDLNSKGLINRAFNVNSIKEIIKLEDLNGEKWLLIYESILKGWIDPEIDPILDNKFFKLMREMNISFYDDTFTSRPEETVEPIFEPSPHYAGPFGYRPMM